MASGTEGKRRGRPPKDPADKKRGNLTFRVRDGMREQLEASAKARGMSISEEVEKRLERSFDTAGNPMADLMLKMIADNWRIIQEVLGVNMIDDEFALNACASIAKSAVLNIGYLHLRRGAPINDDSDLTAAAAIFGQQANALRTIDKGKVDWVDEQLVERLRQDVQDTAAQQRELRAARQSQVKDEKR